jgi:hypothetical protein
MLKFRWRRLVIAGGLAMIAVLVSLLATTRVLDDGEPNRQRLTLQDLSESDLDRIVVQLQDPRLDRLSPSVAEDYRNAVVLAGDDSRPSREPLAVLP